MKVWAARRFVQLPDQPLYTVRPPWSWLMRGGQTASLGLLLASIWAMGVAPSNGIAQLQSLLQGKEPLPEPEAQGPALGAGGEMAAIGPFRFIRHPGDLAAIGIFVLFPQMTINRAVLAALAVIYS